MMRFLSLITLVLFLSSSGWAYNSIKQMQLLVMPTSNFGSGNYSDQLYSNKILQKSMTAADTSQTVVAKIIDNSLTYWWNNSDLKNTSVGKVANTIEQNLKAEVDMGTSGENKTDHKVSLSVLVLQALAKIEYKGWVKAAINYDVKAAKAEVEVLENLSNNKDLVISHSITANENKSQLSLRWNW